MISDPEYFSHASEFQLRIEPVYRTSHRKTPGQENFSAWKRKVARIFQDIARVAFGFFCLRGRDQYSSAAMFFFAASIGRWRLARWRYRSGLLAANVIRKQLFPLGSDVTVLPGGHVPTDKDSGSRAQNEPFSEAIRKHSLPVRHRTTPGTTCAVGGRYVTLTRFQNTQRSVFCSSASPSISVTTMWRNVLSRQAHAQ